MTNSRRRETQSSRQPKLWVNYVGQSETDPRKKPDTEDEPGIFPVAYAEERSLLGAALMGRANEICKLFTVTDFGISAHRDLFAAIADCVAAGEGDSGRLEFAAVASALAANKKLEAVGGLAFVCDLTTGCCPSRPLEFRLRRLREFSARRQLLRLAEELQRRASDLALPIDATLAFLQESASR